MVAFTANIGLAKPTNSELAKDWTHVQKYAEDNNNLIIAESNLPLTTYTPLIIAATTAPGLGASGALKGEYQDLMGIIMGSFVIEFTGAGITAGTGEYAVSLPYQADSSFYQIAPSLTSITGPYSVIGEGYGYDASYVEPSGSFVLDLYTSGGTSYVRLITEAYTIPAKTSRVMRDGQPFAVADGDRIAGNFIYKRA